MCASYMAKWLNASIVELNRLKMGNRASSPGGGVVNGDTFRGVAGGLLFDGNENPCENVGLV